MVSLPWTWHMVNKKSTNFFGASWLMLSSSASSLGEMVSRSQPARASTWKSLINCISTPHPPLQCFWNWRPWQQSGSCASCSSCRSCARSALRDPPLPHRSLSASPDETKLLSLQNVSVVVPDTSQYQNFQYLVPMILNISAPCTNDWKVCLPCTSPWCGQQRVR